MIIDTTFRSDLLPGERVLWSGAPARGLMFRASDLLLLPFGVMFTAFSLFWEWMAIENEAPLFFRFWGVPFV
ncbi:MAG: PH domain-containing protein, partial [Phyllobacteriaceae bacterium]|nr:PH domain-containing protein [Phyllobacteriaceae bacterium]